MKVEKLSKFCLVLIQKKIKMQSELQELIWIDFKWKKEMNLNANVMETYFTPYSRNSHLVKREKF